MKVLFATALIFTALGLVGFTPFSEYTATAYSLKSRMSCGERPKRGIIAADSRFLKHGISVEITGAGKYSGTYRVCDAGVKGRKIDLWLPSKKESLTFGRKSVRLRVVV